MELHLVDETAPLEAVVLGRADQMGGLPILEDLYDPKSKAHLLDGTYPVETDLVNEMNAFKKVLEKYGVRVLHPSSIPDCNQIFARDLGFVIDDVFVQSNILPLREKEIEGLSWLKESIPTEKQLILNPAAHIEGGDVLLMGNHIFVGVCTRPDYPDLITARTNWEALKALRYHFPDKTIHPIELKKSDDPYQNALHLDCIFQPVGPEMAILHPNGFVHPSDYERIKSHFKPNALFEINETEMYEMMSNIFSIAPDVVVSDPSFDRLNQWLKKNGITVEEVSYREVAKQEGLFRCTTLPLRRL
ncbi:MAG: dimethylarginine dimethylaminohydrolase family protein [Flavobacteriaceae bacterium]